VSYIVPDDRLYAHLRQLACDVLARQLKGVGADIDRQVSDVVRKAQSSFEQNAGFRGGAGTQLNEAQWQRSIAGCVPENFSFCAYRIDCVCAECIKTEASKRGNCTMVLAIRWYELLKWWAMVAGGTT